MAEAKKGVMLLDFWASPFGLLVWIALAEKVVKYEYLERDLWQKSALKLEYNHVHKKIPVLIQDGKPACESLLIIEYIDKVWNDKASLLPKDAYAKVHARFWADFINHKEIHGFMIQ